MSEGQRRSARVLLLLVILGLAFWSLSSQWTDFSASVSEMEITAVGLALSLAIAALLTSAAAWTELLNGLEPTKKSTGLPFFLTSQLGKYLPGGIGPALAQASLAGEFGISKAAAAKAYLVFAAQTVVLGVVFAVVSLPLGGSDLVSQYWWVTLSLPLLLPILHPRILHWLLTAVAKRLRPGLEIPLLPWSAALRSGGWTCLTWLLLGSHVGALALSYEPVSVSLLLLSLGGFCLAWVAGFLILFLPAGLGAREVVLVATLSLVLLPSNAAALAVVSRAVLTVADLLVGLIASVMISRSRRTARHPLTPT